MSKRLPILLCLSTLITASAFAQDTRPFGKYLVLVCSLGLQGNNVSCSSPAVRTRTLPSIELNMTPPPPAPAPVYPIPPGSNFYVSAVSPEGFTVSVASLSSNAVPVALAPGAPPLPPGIFQFHVTEPGPIVLQANLPGDEIQAPGPAVWLALDAGTAADLSCKGLLPLPSKPRSIAWEASNVISVLGTPTPFVLVPQGKGAILVYSTRYGSSSDPATAAREASILAGLQPQIRRILLQNPESIGFTPAPKPFAVELRVPHAASLGDLTSRIAALNYSQFTVQDVGSRGVRVSASSQPECQLWTSFLTDLRRSAWELVPEPSSTRLFYMGDTGAKDVSDAFKALQPAAPAPSPAPPPAPSPAPSPAPPASASNATISVTQAAGSTLQLSSDTTACVAAGLAIGNSGACVPPAAPAPAAATPPAPSAVTPKPPSIAIAPLQSDTLLHSSSNPGDDAQIAERNRIIAQLDLPRPEMIINGWVLQNSTTSSKAIGAYTNKIREVVGDHNEKLENMMLKAWASIRAQIAAGNFFDPTFYSYIVDRYVGEVDPPAPGANPSAAAEAFLETTPAKMALPAGKTRSDFGICETGRYCLGYVNLFQPLKPRLTDMLLTLIAARDTTTAIGTAIAVAEGTKVSVPAGFCGGRATGSPEERDRCRALWTNLGLDRTSESCESEDFQFILGSAFRPAPSGYERPRVYLSCFRKEAFKLLRQAPADSSALEPSGAALMRATVANFLFNYKMSQQYPHEFNAYDLSQSADALNSALNPLINAFNRDLAAFQQFVRADVLYSVERINREYDSRCCAKRLFSLDKPSFFNDGIVTVRTISGQWTYAASTSQSFVDASTAPQLAGLLASVAGTGATPATASASPLLGAAALVAKGPLASTQLASGILNAYQTTHAQIGRSLAISAVPRSLATASSAEIVVSLNADETATPTYYDGPHQGANANISRVATHDTSTRVRVESVKLFEISSFAAVLQKSRSRFPLLPPFLELPYIGTIAGIPLPPAKEYHQSTAILSAVVVPTAADLAYGLQFMFDDVVDSDQPTCSLIATAGQTPCRLRRALSPSDLKQPVNGFHRQMVHCLGTGMWSPYSSLNGLTLAGKSACNNLAFSQIPK